MGISLARLDNRLLHGIIKKQHIPILRMVSMMVRKFLLYVMIHR